MLHDLEEAPWPIPDCAAEAVEMHHVLEHLGATTASFRAIMREIYRICRNGASVGITVPHPRHDNFLGDPTHVRPITPQLLELFSRRMNAHWREIGTPHSRLAEAWGVDFEITERRTSLEGDWYARFSRGDIDEDELRHAMATYNNVVAEYHIVLQARK
ncbi:MAG: hypothetical protein HQL39_08920 [Alphaproteobacteria bacterium]|nr:hypothetical protein [Alphaproteobacteria bacterium]